MVRTRQLWVDLGCGTGMSTRWLARNMFPSDPYPNTKLLGLDLSPYYVAVGRRLLELAPRQRVMSGSHDHTLRK